MFYDAIVNDIIVYHYVIATLSTFLFTIYNLKSLFISDAQHSKVDQRKLCPAGFWFLGRQPHRLESLLG